jgi:hypothetical protein
VDVEQARRPDRLGDHELPLAVYVLVVLKRRSRVTIERTIVGRVERGEPPHAG